MRWGERLTEPCEGDCPWKSFLWGATADDTWPRCIHPSTIARATANYVDLQRFQIALAGSGLYGLVAQNPEALYTGGDPNIQMITDPRFVKRGEEGLVIMPDHSVAVASPVHGGGYQIGCRPEDGDTLDAWVPLLIPSWVESTDEGEVCQRVLEEDEAWGRLLEETGRIAERDKEALADPVARTRSLATAIYLHLKKRNLPLSGALLGQVLQEAAPDLGGLLAEGDYEIARRGAAVATTVAVFPETLRGRRELVCKITTTASISCGTRNLMNQIWRIRQSARERLPELLGIRLASYDNLRKYTRRKPKGAMERSEDALVRQRSAELIDRDAFYT